REDGPVCLIAGVAGIEGDGFLIKTITEEERVNQPAGIAPVENAVSAAKYSLALTIERVGEPHARSKRFFIRRDAPRRGIVGIGERWLRQVRVVIAQPEVESQPLRHFILILRKKRVVFDKQIHDWVADRLGERRPIFTSRRVPREVLRQRGETGEQVS